MRFVVDAAIRPGSGRDSEGTRYAVTWTQNADIDRDAGTERRKYVGTQRCWRAGGKAASETRILDAVVTAWEWLMMWRDALTVVR